MNTPRYFAPDLETLVGLFYADSSQLGTFQEVDSSKLPAPYVNLLDHNEHMTVTVEAFHESLVDVEVLEAKRVDHHYARKILLIRQTDGKVVQFGIVRLCFEFLESTIQSEIESEQIPLGRILIEHDVLRQVQLASLWRIETGEELSDLLKVPLGTETFGRTALIYCNGEPAVELLEIMTLVKNRTNQ